MLSSLYLWSFSYDSQCLSDDDDEEVSAALDDPFELPASDSPGE